MVRFGKEEEIDWRRHNDGRGMMIDWKRRDDGLKPKLGPWAILGELQPPFQRAPHSFGVGGEVGRWGGGPPQGGRWGGGGVHSFWSSRVYLHLHNVLEHTAFCSKIIIMATSIVRCHCHPDNKDADWFWFTNDYYLLNDRKYPLEFKGSHRWLPMMASGYLITYTAVPTVSNAYWLLMMVIDFL